MMRLLPSPTGALQAVQVMTAWHREHVVQQARTHSYVFPPGTGHVHAKGPWLFVHHPSLLTQPRSLLSSIAKANVRVYRATCKHKSCPKKQTLRYSHKVFFLQRKPKAYIYHDKTGGGALLLSREPVLHSSSPEKGPISSLTGCSSTRVEKQAPPAPTGDTQPHSTTAITTKLGALSRTWKTYI